MHRPQEEIGKAFNQASDSLHMLARRHALVLSSAAFSYRDLLNSCTTGASRFFARKIQVVSKVDVCAISTTLKGKHPFQDRRRMNTRWKDLVD